MLKHRSRQLHQSIWMWKGTYMDHCRPEQRTPSLTSPQWKMQLKMWTDTRKVIESTHMAWMKTLWMSLNTITAQSLRSTTQAPLRHFHARSTNPSAVGICSTRRTFTEVIPRTRKPNVFKGGVVPANFCEIRSVPTAVDRTVSPTKILGFFIMEVPDIELHGI